MKYVPTFGLMAQVFGLIAAPVFAFLVIPSERLAANVAFLISFGFIYLAVVWVVLFWTTYRILVVDEHLIAFTAFTHRVVRFDEVLSVGPALMEWGMFRIRIRGQRGIHGRSSNGFGDLVAHLLAERPSIRSGYARGKPRTDQYVSSKFTEMTDDELVSARRLIAASAVV
ncbi:hypothetical protein KXS11_11980 [Plantibacter flavus]|uniref:hypothetical protein n=1 Tax=Plantibacter flavus TaxID=150123 RepID=UPI003F164DC3